jgi:hypothetical protein
MFSPYTPKDAKHQTEFNRKRVAEFEDRTKRDKTERSRIHSAALKQHEDRMEAKALNEDWWGDDD